MSLLDLQVSDGHMLAEKTFSYENENLVSVLLPRVIKEETKLSSHLKEADVGSEIDTTSS